MHVLHTHWRRDGGCKNIDRLGRREGRRVTERYTGKEILIVRERHVGENASIHHRAVENRDDAGRGEQGSQKDCDCCGATKHPGPADF